MKVDKIELLISAVEQEQYPTINLPEIALAGRSNVGKSSLINKLLNRKKIARISSKPGKTQTLNFYKINEDLIFVDVPGYGYAGVSKQQRSLFGQMMETYFTTRENLKVVCLLTDGRHPPTEDDVLMYQFFKHYEIPCVVIMTKMDKLSRNVWQKQVDIHKDKLNFVPEDRLIKFSAVTGYGKAEVWFALLQLCRS